MSSEVNVFISYSHDSDAHSARVLSLSESLRKDGVETILDRYVKNGSPAEGWPRWMLRGLEAATHVVCVCTERYHQRFLGKEIPGQGKGVDWEGALMSQTLYDARSVSNKFIPVIFEVTDEGNIPLPLRGQTHYLLGSDAGYKALYDALLGQSVVKPAALGPLTGHERPKGDTSEVEPPKPPTPAPKIPSEHPALTIWRDKLNMLLMAEALCTAVDEKFRLQHLITEAQGRIRALAEEP